METNEPALCFDHRTTDHSERLYQAISSGLFPKSIFSSVPILITELTSQSLTNKTGQEFRVSNGYAMYIAVPIRLTVSSINPVAFSRKLLKLIDPEIQQVNAVKSASTFRPLYGIWGILICGFYCTVSNG